jgi:hypothetical protein
MQPRDQYIDKVRNAGAGLYDVQRFVTMREPNLDL